MTPFLAALALSLCASAQVAEKANETYKTAEGREEVARRLSGPERAENIHATGLIKWLALKPGDTAADVGSGTGILLPYLSTAVGPSGKVISEDIFPDFQAKARAHAEREKAANVTFVLGTEKSPNLPDACCDRVVVVDAYHHFDYPAQMLAGMRSALKPSGRLAIVEYYKRYDAMGNGNFALEHIRIDKDAVIQEIESNGFKLASSTDLVAGKQYLAIFEKK
jgi:predicted methyltransferase